jgi:hypothetical protein
VARARQRVLAAEGPGHVRERHARARDELRVALGDAVEFHGGRAEFGGERVGLRRHLALRVIAGRGLQVGRRVEDRGEPQRIDIVHLRPSGRWRLRRRDGRLVLEAPAADAHLTHLLGGRHRRPQRDQVDARLEDERVLGRRRALGGRVRRRLGQPEVQRAVRGGDLRAAAVGQPRQELPVGDVVLAQLRVRRVAETGHRVDDAREQSGALGDGADDFGDAHVRVGGDAAAPEQPVRPVEAADLEELAVGVEVELDGDDLTGHEPLRGTGFGGRHRHLDERAHGEVGLRDHELLRVAEAQVAGVGQIAAGGDAGLGEHGGDVGRQRHPVDRDDRRVREALVGHAATARRPTGSRAATPVAAAPGRRCRWPRR